MILDKLTLTQYRGAAISLPLAFDKKLNVLCGINGAGKSTILDALAIMLSWAVSRIRHANASGRPIHEEDITNGKSWVAIQMSCLNGEDSVFWRLMKSRAGHGNPEDKSSFTSLNEFTKSLQEQVAETAEQTNIPLFVYYPVNRAVLDIPLRIRKKHPLTLLTAYDDALTSGANFRTFFEWFREREDLENEHIRDTLSPLMARLQDERELPRDNQLQAVRHALTQFMPEFSSLTVRRNPLRMTVEKNGQRLNVNQLSDGEKCMIALIGDLARRLAIANPMRANPLEGEGIVLIDEVDLHLHPRWQRIVVPKLQEVFPECQFVLSTHSPHVITHVRPESLFLITQNRNGILAEKPSESYGKNVDRVLEDLMGLETTRPDAVDARLQTLFQTIDAGKLNAARTQIGSLKKLIGDDPDLAKADVLIRRKEIIGK